VVTNPQLGGRIVELLALVLLTLVGTRLVVHDLKALVAAIRTLWRSTARQQRGRTGRAGARGGTSRKARPSELSSCRYATIVPTMPTKPSPRKPRYQKTNVQLPSNELTLYVGSKIRSALQEVTTDMDLYHGVRLGEVMEAVYEQGRKDGRREIIAKIDGLKIGVKYLPPGRPKKKRKPPS